MSKVALRDRQTELTRDLILKALAELIREGRLAEFSVQDVADRAGVSLRTVYRHFASREALLEGFTIWANAKMRGRSAGALNAPIRADDLGPHVRAKFAAFERLAPVQIPIVKLIQASQTYRAESSEYLEGLRSALTEVTCHLDEELANAVVWTIRMMCSSQTWRALHEEGHVDGAHAGAATAWAVDLLIEALRGGSRPTLTDPTLIDPTLTDPTLTDPTLTEGEQQ